MSTFSYQKTELLNYYEKSDAIFEKHHQMFGELITKLNENKTYNKEVVGNLDDFMSKSFEKFQTFSQTVETNKLNKYNISYIFDMNKNEYINITGLSLDERFIIKDLKYKLKSGQYYQTKNNLWNPTSDKLNNFHGNFNTNNLSFIISQNMYNPYRANNNAITCRPVENQMYFTESECNNLHFIIDNYMNIYVPALKTYYMFNYNSFPLYSFFINTKKLNALDENENPSKVILFNNLEPGEKQQFDKLKKFVAESSSYLSSQDKRNIYKNEYHMYLVDFYNYNEKIKYFEQFLTLSEEFSNILPINNTLLFESQNNSSIDEEQQIFLQSNRIQELNIKLRKQEEELEYLRRERNQLIELNNNKEIEINSRSSLIADINDNLKCKISEFSKIERENIILKTKLLKVDELDAKNRKLKSDLDKAICNIQDNQSILREKDIVNETLMDKQLEQNNKLEILSKEKQELNYSLTEYHLKIKSLEDEIRNLRIKCETREKEIRLTQNRLDTVIQQLKKDEQDNFSKNSEYQQILLKQIKEKTDLLKVAYDKIKRIELSYDKVKKDYSGYKIRVARLVE
jgi:hypothetical protein